jgi:hypothetical protein
MSQGSAQGAKMHAASPMISPGLGTHARTHADRRVSFSEG